MGTTRYSYGSVGQLLSEDGPWDSETVSYSYNNRFRSGASVLQPNASAWAVSYGYDAAKRLTDITSLAGAFGYQYVAGRQSLVAKLTEPGNSYITNHYDSVARLLFTKMLDASAGVLDSETYSYNPGNQRTQQVFTAGNYVDYAYDDIGQLKTAKGKESGGTSRALEQMGYTYDAAGNLNWRTNNAFVQTFNVNTLNELKTVTRGGTLTAVGDERTEVLSASSARFQEKG